MKCNWQICTGTVDDTIDTTSGIVKSGIGTGFFFIIIEIQWSSLFTVLPFTVDNFTGLRLRKLTNLFVVQFVNLEKGPNLNVHSHKPMTRVFVRPSWKMRPSVAVKF